MHALWFLAHATNIPQDVQLIILLILKSDMTYIAKQSTSYIIVYKLQSANKSHTVLPSATECTA